MQEAVKRGESIAGELEANARDKAGQFLERAEGELEREVRTARLQLREKTVDMAIAAAEKIIQEELDDQKHRKLVEDFITRLGESRA
jgi:F-type H+-transporting ATPase subunit b